MIHAALLAFLITQTPPAEQGFPKLPTDNSPASIEARLHYLGELERAKDWNGLEAICLYWLKSEPNDPSAWFGIGNANSGRKNYPKAVEAYRKAVGIMPGMWRSWWNLGVVYHETHDHPGMAECFKEIQKIEPSIARSFRRGVIGMQ